MPKSTIDYHVEIYESPMLFQKHLNQWKHMYELDILKCEFDNGKIGVVIKRTKL